MKKRYLRKEIDIALNIVFVVLMVFFGSLNDFTMKSIPLLMVLLATEGLCLIILRRYSKIWK